MYEHTDGLISEKTAFQPISNKGLTKLSERNLCLYYAHNYDMPIRLARIFRAYGPKEEQDRLILSILLAAKNKTPIKLSSPEIVRDYTFIDDLVEGILKIAHTDLASGEEINIASGVPSNSSDIVLIIEDILRIKINISKEVYHKMPADRTNCMVDISKAKELLNWVPKTSMEEGLKQTYNWWETNYG